MCGEINNNTNKTVKPIGCETHLHLLVFLSHNFMVIPAVFSSSVHISVC